MKLFVPLLDNGNASVIASFMRDFFEAFRQRHIVSALASDSHANRGMNKIANAFVKGDCDVWFNIDADIRFRKQDVDSLIEHIEAGVPLVYGIYPKKEDAASPCLCTFQTIDEPDPKTGLVQMRRCGRGFMLVKREVLEAMKEDNGGPALRYHNHGPTADGRNHEWDFFPSGCVTGAFSALEHRSPDLCAAQASTPVFPKDPDGFPIREWISEDWYFCERARALGYPTLVDARVALGHVGIKEYRMSQDQVTRFDSYITSWREIHGWFDYADFYKELAVKMGTGTQASTPVGRTDGTQTSRSVGRTGVDACVPVFVEIGCWMGKSIAAMAEFLQKLDKKAELHVVDTFKGAPANQTQAEMLAAHGGNVGGIFRANMEALGIECVDAGAVEFAVSADGEDALGTAHATTITVHERTSEAASHEFANESIDVAFIDGDHSMEAVYSDICSWWPKIKPDGILCGHDIDETGVAAAVKGAFADFQVRGRCWIVQKAGKEHRSPDLCAAQA